MPIMTMTIERQRAVQQRESTIKYIEEWGWDTEKKESLGKSREVNGQTYYSFKKPGM